jgi:glycine cleavage system regulatory protein
MRTHLVITVIGPDRPGLVSAISEAIASAGGNWLDSRMANLGGQFAGMLLVEVAPEQAEELTTSLRALEAQGLKLVIAASDTQVPVVGRTLSLDVIGLDRPGIVRDLSRVIAAQGVSITELESEQVSGSFSGEAMFKAKARLTLPPDLDIETLRRSLETIAHELMVDFSLDDE